MLELLVILISKRQCNLGYQKNRHCCPTLRSHTLESRPRFPPQNSTPWFHTKAHPRLPPQWPTPGSHPRVSPQSPNLGSHPRVAPQGLTPESGPRVLGPGSWVPPQWLGPTFPVWHSLRVTKQLFYDKNIMIERKKTITEKPWQNMLHNKTIRS